MSEADYQEGYERAETAGLLPAIPMKQAVAVTDAGQQPLTPQEARTIEVTEALAPAYAKASTLELTDTEVAALMAPFPDTSVDIRPHDGLIYISHIHISNRLNQVFKPGKWALVRRREWMESGTMYGEYVLLIRGCYVGESIGGHPYQPNNPKVNYSDTLEATAGEALRRICGKRLSCGSQVWEPDYARRWVATNARQANGKWSKSEQTGNRPPPQKPPPETPQTDTAKTPTAKTRAWFVAQIPEQAASATCSYFENLGALLPSETLAELPLKYVPVTKAELQAVVNAVEAFVETGEARPAFEPHNEAPIIVPRDPEPAEPEAWRSFPVPFGKDAGTPLEDMDKKTLFGWWANFKVEDTFKGKPRKPEQIATDTKFREMLDAAGEHYEFKAP